MNLLALTRENLSASITTIHDTFLESANQKGLKIVEGEMQKTLDTRQGTMERDLQNRMNIKLWSLLIENVLIGLVMLKMTHRIMLLCLLILAIQAQTLNDVEDSHVNDIFAKVKGMHAVPHMPGNYMPPKSNFGIDESKFTYGPEKSTTTKSDAKTSNSAFCESNYSVETLESVPKLVANKPKAVGEPKVWFDAPIIEEYESDSDDEHVTIPLKEQEKPIFAFVNTVKHVKTPRQTVKEQNACSQNPKPNKRDWNGLMSKIWVWDI
nr:hypothetical protein [Tanacetum cinerariifolium]